MKKRAVSLFLALALCLGLAVPAFADDVPADTLDPTKYTLENGVLTIHEGVRALGFEACSGSTNMTGDEAFDGARGIVSVVLPASLEVIGWGAFRNCGELTSVTLQGDGALTIEYEAFQGCNQLSSVTIPSGRIQPEIATDAFDGTPWLAGLGDLAIVNNTLFKYQGAGGNVVIPQGVSLITQGAFSSCENPFTLSIPDSVTALQRFSFDRCKLVHVDIPESITELEKDTFRWCENLVSIRIPSGVTTLYNTFYDCPNLTTIYGKTGSYAETYAQEEGMRFVDGPTPTTLVTPIQPAVPATPAAATPTASTVLVNGVNTAFDAYNIGGANYFKLRDLAFVLNGTGKQFEVSWDAAANAISLISGQPYTAVGGEMTAGTGAAKTATPTSSKILLNGAETALEAYNIGGNNYFKLRDLGAAFDFGVDWDGANNTVVIDTGKGYAPD